MPLDLKVDTGTAARTFPRRDLSLLQLSQELLPFRSAASEHRAGKLVLSWSQRVNGRLMAMWFMDHLDD